MIYLEKMHVKDLIVYYLKNEEKEHTAHREEMEFVNEFDEWLDYAVNDNIPLKYYEVNFVVRDAPSGNTLELNYLITEER